jgi:hypothetical protein
MTGGLPAPSPFGAMFDNPIGQGAFKADVSAFLFRFDPFMLEDLFALSLKLPIKGGVPHQVVAIRYVLIIARHNPMIF